MRPSAEVQFMKLLRDCQRNPGNRVSFIRDAMNNPNLLPETRRMAKAFLVIGMEDGGPGSGNWGHKGRPGQVGGSGKGGGSQYRGGRSDIAYFSSKQDWLNGLKGERQSEANKFLKRMQEHYGSDKGKSVEQMIMEEPRTKYGGNSTRQKLLDFMAESRGWDKYASRLVDENLDENEKKLAETLGNKYGLAFVGGVALPDDNDTSAWDADDLRTWQDLKSKAMGGPVSGLEPPDELMYEAGLKERPKPKTDQTWFQNADQDRQDAALGALERASRMSLSHEAMNSGDGIMEAEKTAFENGYSDYQTQRALKVYLAQKWFASDISDFNGEIYDRLDPIEYADFHEMIAEAKKKGDPSPLDTLDYKNNRQRMEGYALINKALGGADVTEDILQKNREAFQKEQEEQKRQLEELKRQNEERARRRQEEERRKAEEAAKRAPIVQAAKERLRNDGLLHTINEAHTAEEAASAISGSGMFKGDGKATFDGMDTTVAKRCAETFSSVFQEYPFLVGELDAPDMAESRKNVYASSSMYSNGAIHFKPQEYADEAALRKSYDRCVASGFHPLGTDYTSIAVHELGHSLDGWLSKKLKAVGQYYDGSPRIDTGVKGTVSYDLCQSVKKAMGEKGKIKDFWEKTSGYAKEGGYKEWFAETFAEAYCSRDPRPIAREFKRQLDKLIRDKGLEVSMNV